MVHKIKWHFLGNTSDFIVGEGYLTDGQIELLKDTSYICSNYYLVELEDGSQFKTYNTNFLNII